MSVDEITNEIEMRQVADMKGYVAKLFSIDERNKDASWESFEESMDFQRREGGRVTSLWLFGGYPSTESILLWRGNGIL